MAAKKATTTKASSRTAAAKKSPARKAPAKTKATVTKSKTTTRVTAAKAATSPSVVDNLPSNLLGIIGAEVVGTFILTLTALVSAAHQQLLPLFVGLTMVVLVMVIGNISGAHVNPAVTFGLWASRKLKTALVPFYWAAQLLGAVIAVLLLRTLSDGAFNIGFSNFSELNWSVASIELIGAAIFVFGFVATLSRPALSWASRGLGIGLSLFAALVVTMTLFPFVQQGVDMSKFDPNDPSTLPREYSVSRATINPAIAVAATESSLAELQGGAPAEGESQHSRFGLETILGTLVGAAVGGNLWLLVARGSEEEL